ncbi:cysteine--tRNA ligase [uncultured Castellaniella sp.]|uniref:cysteine--tRNA ligase n=1 Tax=uncultured Castellaniella sp. TaxID=647907 RepID=UPI00260DB7C8|nr:cysteine--tRNA ligase [uncultured Castellaniella sp.]
MLHIYNTLSRQKTPLRTAESGVVRMYVCGMTVYDFCHLGHARMLVSFDVVQRWLRASGYRVRYVRNITDIDDKIIRRAVERGVPIRTLTEFFIAAMRADERALGVQAPDDEPRATEHVAGMLDIIGVLQSKGLAYQGADGDVNFSVRKFPGYGKLSGKSLDDLRAGERVAVSAGKQDPLDFVLWKSAKPEEPADTRWDSPYGPGRPGWHIECSAMSRSLLGMPLDIHGGGPDLKFPHHENEIAQSEGAFGGTLATTWMHCGPMMVDAEKMSKSLGNFRRIRDTVSDAAADDAADYAANPRESEMLRFFLIRSHYRSVQNYTPDNLQDAQHALDRLYQALNNVPPAAAQIDWESPQARAFRDAMDDDFNTAGAVAVLFDLANQANRDTDAQASGLLRALGGVLGLLQTDPQVYLQSPTRFLSGGAGAASLSAQAIDGLIAERAAAKAARDFARADRIRAELRDQGVELADVAGGATQWRRV